MVLADHAVFALWDLTKPGDPNRSWGVSVTSSAEYDDNFNATEHGQQAGFRMVEDLKFRASVPLERLFAGVQYNYRINYPQDIHRGGVGETHILNLAANYSVSRRLGVSVNETYISTFLPGLVTGRNGVPVTLASAGNYVYDSVGASAFYSLTPRWTASVNGNWDIWRYEETATATNNNHEDYSMTLSAIYALDPRTTVGVNYQYAQTVYVNPGSNGGLNGYANTAFLSLTRRFNPRLSLALDAGYTIRESAAGLQSTSPSGSGSVVYNYGPSSTISLTIAQSLSEATVGISRQFSAQENTSLALQINHRITVKLHALADVTYNYSSFTAPLTPTVTVSPNDQAITAHFSIGYDIREWVSAVMDYSHTELISSDTTLVPPYSRNQISIGMTLAY